MIGNAALGIGGALAAGIHGWNAGEQEARQRFERDRQFEMQQEAQARANKMADAQLQRYKSAQDQEDANLYANSQGGLPEVAPANYELEALPEIGSPAPAPQGQGQSGFEAPAQTPVVVGGKPSRAAGGPKKVQKNGVIPDEGTLVSQANALREQARQKKAYYEQQLSTIDQNPNLDPGQKMRYRAALIQRGGMEISGMLQQADQFYTVAKGQQRKKYLGTAISAFVTGDNETGHKYLDALSPEVSNAFRGLRREGDWYVVERGGKKVKISASDLAVMMDPDSDLKDYMKSFEKTQEFLQKEKEAEMKFREQMAGHSKLDPRLDATERLRRLDAQRAAMDAAGVPADDPRRKDLEATVHNLKGAFNIDRTVTADKQIAQRDAASQRGLVGRVVSSGMGAMDPRQAAPFMDAAKGIVNSYTGLPIFNRNRPPAQAPTPAPAQGFAPPQPAPQPPASAMKGPSGKPLSAQDATKVAALRAKGIPEAKIQAALKAKGY